MAPDKSGSPKRSLYSRVAGALIIAALIAGGYILFSTLLPKTDKSLKGQGLRDFWKTIFTYNATRKDWMAAARVGLRDNRVYVGWPRYWSQTEKNNMLFLAPAYVLEKSGRCTKLKGPGVMLFEEEIEYIEFVNVPAGGEGPCAPQDEDRTGTKNR